MGGDGKRMERSGKGAGRREEGGGGVRVKCDK